MQSIGVPKSEKEETYDSRQKKKYEEAGGDKGTAEYLAN